MYTNRIEHTHLFLLCQLSETSSNAIPVATESPVPRSWFVFYSTIKETVNP